MEQPDRNALIIGTSAAILVLTWLVLWFFVWRSSPKRPPLPMVALFALSSAMSFVWLFVAIYLGLFFTPLDHRDASSDVFDWSFGLTGTLFGYLFNRFPQFHNPDDVVGNLLVLLALILPFFSNIAFFFLLSMLPARFVRRKEQQVK